MSQWHYTKDGEKQGPLTNKQLKELAASGQLLPDDLIWREGMKEWAKAKAVKGLFVATTDNPAEPPPVPPSVPPVAAEAVTPVWQTPEFWKTLSYNPVVIALSFLFCGPVGIVLIATHPRISRKVKLIGAGCAGACMVLLFIVAIISIQMVNKQVLEADALWEEGKQEEAVAIYEKLVNEGLLMEDKKPRVYGRLIDYELAHEEEAKWEQLGEDRFRISDWEVKARQNGVYAEPESALGREIVWLRDAMRAHEELSEQERLVDAGEKVVLEDHPWYFDRPWYNGDIKKAITEIREKIKATSSQNQVAETKTSSETTTSSGGVKVSRGKYVRGNIEIIIEVAPHLTEHVEISNLRVVDPFLLFYLKCDSGTHVPRVFSCYNEDGVKLREGELSLPSRFNTGETVEGKIILPHTYHDIDVLLIKISSS